MNNCSFIGRVGRDAETRYTQAGKPVTGWALAVDVGFGDNKQTLWVDCNLWGERGAKVADYIRKGSQVGVAGELGTREHNGKTYVTLNVQNVTLVGGKPEGQPKPQGQAPASRPEPSNDDFRDDDVPFN